MLKFLFFAVLFFLLVRYINRMFLPSGSKRQSRFNTYQGSRQSRRRDIDEIEEAEYEDLSQNDK